MASTNIPTKLKLSQINGGNGTTANVIDFDTDTLKCMIVVAGSGIPATSKTGIQYVSDVTGTNAEVAGDVRQTLTSVTAAFDGSGTTLVDFNFANITFAQAQGWTNGAYIIFYKFVSTDANSPVFAVCDPSQTLNVSVGDIVLQCPAAGLIQWQ
jgi:hypothetical protein